MPAVELQMENWNGLADHTGETFVLGRLTFDAGIVEIHVDRIQMEITLDGASALSIRELYNPEPLHSTSQDSAPSREATRAINHVWFTYLLLKMLPRKLQKAKAKGENIPNSVKCFLQAAAVEPGASFKGRITGVGDVSGAVMLAGAEDK